MSKLNILLCDDHLSKCESRLFKTKYPEDEPCLMCIIQEMKIKNDNLQKRIDKTDSLIMSFGDSIDVPLRNSLIDSIRGLEDL